MHNDSNGRSGNVSSSLWILSCIPLVKSPLKVFGKGRQDLEGDWAMRPSVTFKRTNRSRRYASQRLNQLKQNVKSLRCCFRSSFNVKMPSSSDKTASTAASALISVVAAIVCIPILSALQQSSLLQGQERFLPTNTSIRNPCTVANAHTTSSLP